MSHFAVIVIGEDAEKQLAPYHEFECTGLDDEYIQTIDQTAENREEWEASEKENYSSFREFLSDYHGRAEVAFGETPDLTHEHKYGYTLLNEAGEVLQTFDRTNPNRKWDWYQVGGRWNGFFRLKPGRTALLGQPGLQVINPNYRPPEYNTADVCFKGDIDVEAMRREAGEKAARDYDLLTSLTEGLPEALSWDAAIEKFTCGAVTDWTRAREFYHAQPKVAALKKDKGTLWWNLEDFSCTREEYIENAENKAVLTFAVVKDGQWYEKGQMGWFGVVSGEKDKTQWAREFSELFDSLSDDTLITLVDCHI